MKGCRGSSSESDLPRRVTSASLNSVMALDERRTGIIACA